MATDVELLERYCREGSESAFSALVARHVDLAYSTAKRVVGSPDLAREVTQTVFLELAGAARRLRPDSDLAAWVYVAARRRGIDVVRQERRRMKREQVAAEQLQRDRTGTGIDVWQAIRPYLDEALGRLSDGERAAVIRRFFQSQGFKEIGEELGISEDAAQKRVSRALERLRQILARRGVLTGAAALASAVTAHAVERAPAELGKAIGAEAVRGAGTAATHARVSHVLGRWLLPLAAAASLGVFACTVHLRRVQERGLAELQEKERAMYAALRAERARSLELARAAHESAAAPEPQDSIHQEAEVLTQRIARLHDWMKRVPQDAAPEMALLTDRDWVVEAANSPALDDYDADPIAQLNTVQSSLGRLDGVVSQRLIPKITAAARRYMSRHGQVPSTVSELVPYFDKPIDPSCLTGFTLTRNELGSKIGLSLGYFRVCSGWSQGLDLGP